MRKKETITEIKKIEGNGEKILALILAAVMLLLSVSCTQKDDHTPAHNLDETEYGDEGEQSNRTDQDESTDKSITDISTETASVPPLFSSLVFTAEEHPELDFGAWEHDGEPMIRDYAITPQDTVLILQMSGVVSEYNLSGDLIGVYDYTLAEQGLSAFRVCSSRDEIFLIDGLNNAILTCDREKVKNVSFVGWKELSLAMNYFECDSEGRPCFSTAAPGTTFAIEVNGENAEIAVRKNGFAVSPDYTFETKEISSTAESEGLCAHIYKNCRPYRNVSFTSLRAPTEKIKKTLIGLTLLEMSDEGYIFAVIEYVPDPVNMTKVNTIQTFVLVTENAEAYEFDSGCDSLTLVHYHGANAYFLTRGDGSITILSLDAAGAEHKKTQNYKVMIELAE